MQATLDLVKEYPNIINVFAIVIGWIIINIQNNKRETRKETRAAINDLQTLITSLSADAIIYHTKDRDRNLESKIASTSKVLNSKIEFAVKPLGSNHSEKINYFTNALMMDNFGGKHIKLKEDNFILIKIAHGCNELSLDLEEQYSSSFHGSNWFTRLFF